jgi:simple sugar transport system ATP-binding protein
LRVAPGEIVALLGPNGAGKSTALRTLVGLVAPEAGTAALFGCAPTVDAARARVGWQAQQTALYHLIHVDEAIDLFGSYYPRRRATDALLATFGLTRRRRTEFRRLSGGERQRLALALAWVNEPDLLILDEPTVALALKEVQKVLDFVRRIKASGRAAIYIEHNLAHVHELADRLVVLDRGEVVSVISQGDMSLADLTTHLLDLQDRREHGDV